MTDKNKKEMSNSEIQTEIKRVFADAEFSAKLKRVASEAKKEIVEAQKKRALEPSDLIKPLSCF